MASATNRTVSTGQLTFVLPFWMPKQPRSFGTLLQTLCDARILGGAADSAEERHAVAFETARVVVGPQGLPEDARQRGAQLLVVLPQHLLVLLLVLRYQLAIYLQRRVTDLQKFPIKNKFAV